LPLEPFGQSTSNSKESPRNCPGGEPGADAGPRAAQWRRWLGLRSGCGKGKRSAQLVHALEKHKEQQEKERVAAGSLWRDSPCVFTTPIGTPVDPRSDYREFKKLLGKAGVSHVRLHDLRHTAAGLLLAQGVPARVVMEILGHSQIALTMNPTAMSPRKFRVKLPSVWPGRSGKTWTMIMLASIGTANDGPLLLGPQKAAS